MNTKIIEIKENEIDGEKIKEAARALKEGKLVAFPTETVYGIGANALSADAAKKIYIAKGRPSDNPLIVHLANWKDASAYVKNISEKAEKLAATFMPGPLTMVLEKRENIPPEITGGLNTVGIRVPCHSVAAALLKEAKIPVAAPSANLSGKPSPTGFEHVREDLSGRVEIIIRSGTANVGLESTVIDMSHEVPVILRPGGITKEQIEAVIGEVKINRGGVREKEIPVAPGMKYRHYAPQGKLHLLPAAGFEENLQALRMGLEKAKQSGKKTAALVPSEYIEALNDFETFDLGKQSDLEEIARHLFDGLRTMDLKEIEEIYAISYPEEGMGEAIMNRLRKAAGQKSMD